MIAALFCGAMPKPTDQFYVNDYAGVLSEQTKHYIMSHSAALEKETKAQIVILTVQTLDGQDPASYGLEVGRSWGIGGEQEDNGLLILLATEDGEIRVEVGTRLEGALNDAKVGRLIDDYALSYYKQGDFDTGSYELYNALLANVMEEYGLESLAGYEDALQQEEMCIRDRQRTMVH